MVSESIITTSATDVNSDIKKDELFIMEIIVTPFEDTIPIDIDQEKEELQQAKNSFVFGLVALTTSLLGLGIPFGIILGTMAIVNGNEAKDTIAENPGRYSNAKNAESGIWLGIASIILIIMELIAAFFLLFLLLDIFTF